ncbi:MAG: DUF4070 domain-containing protein [bacterium]
MKVLLINPQFPASLWSFTGISDLVGASMGQAPLGLLTVAALTPREHDVTLVDENVEPIDFDAEADLVGITAFNVQFSRAIEIAKVFRRRGIPVAIGGPYVSLVPERAEGHFDRMFVGEAEYIWPQFFDDLKRGGARERYVQEKNVAIADSPVPRFDLLRFDRYLHTYVQTSRGCPFECEFCDIIITDGRVPRVKPVAQVMNEIEAIHALGGQSIAFSDANFIGNPRYAKELLIEMAKWNKERGFPVRFGGELTLNLAEKPDLMRLMREANFESIFIGIESPRATSLLETKKGQNVRGEMLERIHRIQRHNLVLTAGMIVGFDSDDTAIFEEQFDFLREAGIPFTTAGILTALEKTPLHARLAREGRLLDVDFQNTMGHGAADLNYVPHGMTQDELLAGYNWLVRSLYKYENYAARLVAGLNQYTKEVPEGQEKGRGPDWKSIKILARTLSYYLLRGGRQRRRFFVSTIREAARTGLPPHKLVALMTYLIAHKHFHEYVTATHGDPESVALRSPFHGVPPREARATVASLANVASVARALLPEGAAGHAPYVEGPPQTVRA